MSAQLRALKDYAKANGYSVAREYVDKAESGRVADRPQFREMIEEGSKPSAPFEVILVWKFSRFTRKREHAVTFKSMLRRKGIRVVSITEHAADSPTSKLMEAIIESVDEFYSENLAQEVTRGYERRNYPIQKPTNCRSRIRKMARAIFGGVEGDHVSERRPRRKPALRSTYNHSHRRRSKPGCPARDRIWTAQKRGGRRSCSGLPVVPSPCGSSCA